MHITPYIRPFTSCSNLGGGGERVLWAAVQYMQTNKPDIVNVVYTGDIEATKEQIINKVKVRLFIVHSLC